VQFKGKNLKYLQPQRRGKQQQRRGGNQSLGGNYNRRRADDPDAPKASTVNVKSSWHVVEQFDLAELKKLSAAVPTASDLLSVGEARKYDDTLDKTNPRNPRALRLNTNVSFVYAGTLEDPVLERLIVEKKGNVFATDETLAYLMTAPRTLAGWDLVFTRIADCLFIDKRDDAGLEVLTVNETMAKDKDDVKRTDVKPLPFNTSEKLGIEATAISQSFLLQALLPPPSSSNSSSSNNKEEASPFVVDDQPPPQPVQYRYRSWKLGAHTLVARTELHGVQTSKEGNEKRALTCFAVNEYDPKLAGAMDWRRRLDSQSGDVLTNELKNNAAKFGRWTAQSLLAGADLMKLGFVSRVSFSDPSKHVVLRTVNLKPSILAEQIALNERNMWGILKAFVDLVMGKPPGKYLLVRVQTRQDTNKAVLRLYRVPFASFEDDDDNEDEDEDDLLDEDELATRGGGQDGGGNTVEGGAS
jgi:translation initiation factor 3 subunit D